VTEKDVEDVQQGLEAAHITGSEVQKLQEKQRAAVQRAVRERPRAEDDSPRSPFHPDLQDLSFGELGSEQRYDAGSVCLAAFHPDESW
jgi:LAS seventeen-binding protein 5